MELLVDDFIYSYTQESDNEFNEIQILPEQIHEISEILNKIQIPLFENFEIVNEIKQLDYKKFGLDSGKINGAINNTGTEIGNIIKKDGLNKESKSKIVALYKKMFNSIEQFNIDIVDSLFDLSDSDKSKIKSLDKTKISKSIVLFLEVYIVNTILDRIFNIVFPKIGSKIGSIFTAPIIEESAKQLAIRGDYYKEFTIIFNIFEFGSYIKRNSIDGIPIGVDMFGRPIVAKIKLKNNIKARLCCVAMHITTTAIQWITKNEKIQKALGIDPEDEDAKEKCGIFGHIIGWLIHTSWNAAASYSPSFNNFLLNI